MKLLQATAVAALLLAIPAIAQTTHDHQPPATPGPAAPAPMMGPGMMQGQGPKGSGMMQGQGPMGPGMMMGRSGGWMWGVGMWVGGLVMLVFWGAFILVAVLVVRHLAGGFAERDGRSPLDILKRRYASGEITCDQYEQMRKDLEP